MRGASRHIRTLTAGILTAGVLLVGGASETLAHDGIASSDPAAGAVVAEPIDVVTIDFGTEIGADSELALIGPDEAELPSETTVISPTTAQLEFELLDREGAYIVRYLASSVTDGHLIVGAISFTYGSEPGASILPWVLFGIAAAVILAIGLWFSLRAHRSARSEDRDHDDVLTSDTV